MFLREKVPRFLRNRPGKKNPFRGFPKTESADEGVGGARRGRKKSAEIRSSRGPRRGAWGHEGRGAPANAAAPKQDERGEKYSPRNFSGGERGPRAALAKEVLAENFSTLSRFLLSAVGEWRFF
jgi:hypothetical protein